MDVSAAKKLQVKDGWKVRVVNQPDGVALDVETTTAEPAEGVLVFVRSKADLAAHAGPAIEAARADRLAWIAYPKAGQLNADLNRNILWKLLEGHGVRPVRQIAIDDVWSALRFRPA
jgi:hypothetical protein